jgi:hypothetical protein
MGVGIVQARCRRAALEVDQIDSWTGGRADLVVIADRDDVAGPNGDGGCGRPRRVHRHHVAVEEDEILAAAGHRGLLRWREAVNGCSAPDCERHQRAISSARAIQMSPRSTA